MNCGYSLEGEDMNLNLNSLKEIGSHKRIEKKIEISDVEYRHQVIEIPYPFDVLLDIYCTAGSFVITGTLTGKLLLFCSRCLEKFEYNIEIEIDEEIMKNEIEDLENFDLTELFTENILLSIPIKPICSEECKGLCTVCGQDLNQAECDCDQEMIDPRLAKLKEFYNREKE